jgi:hypothetical protein
MQRLVGHYLAEGLTEWYKIAGSAEFLGNPVGLVSGLVCDWGIYLITS